MTKLRVAVIGAGHLGKIHARLLSTLDSVDLVAVADPSPSAQKQILEQSDVQVVSDYQKILDDIDAAVIATPTRFHYEIASECLFNNVHTLIEKPLTDSVMDARLLVELAERQQCVVQVGHVERFNAAIQHAAAVVGQPKFVQAERMSGYTYRSIDIGVVHDLMIHDIDLVNSFFDGKATQINANGISVFGENEDIAHARVEFDCGGVANLTASRCSFHPVRQMQIFGTEGYAQVDLANHSVKSIRVPTWMRNREFDFFATSLEQQAFVREKLFEEILQIDAEKIDPVNAILCEQQDWLDAIRDKSTPTVSVEAGCEAVEIADGIIQSLKNHAWSATDPRMTGPLAMTYPRGKQQDRVPSELRSPLRRAA